MEFPIYQVDAFTDKVFRGNPAAVVPLNEWLSDDILQKIAMENNLAETAFFVEKREGYHLRWFTPTTEVPLCGHATLASAYVIYNELGYDKEALHFETMSGELIVKKSSDGFKMDFPVSAPKPTKIPDGLEEALGVKILEAHENRFMLVITANEYDVKNAQVDHAKLAAIAPGDFILSAQSDTYDFVSRCFAPSHGIAEDPVTGSAHCVSVPFWAERLGKKVLHAKQVSARGGEIICTLQGDRVELFGKAKPFLAGTIYI